MFQTELAGHSTDHPDDPSRRQPCLQDQGSKGSSGWLRGDRVVDDSRKSLENDRRQILFPRKTPTGYCLESRPIRAFWFGWFAQFPETRLIK